MSKFYTVVMAVTQEMPQESLVTVQLRAELSQCQADRERESRQRKYLLDELAEAQGDFLKVDLRFQLECERSLSLQAEAKNFQNRLTESFVECEKLKEQKKSLQAKVISQRQRLLDSHLQPSSNRAS